jgi:hypothetical protein
MQWVYVVVEAIPSHLFGIPRRGVCGQNASCIAVVTAPGGL